MMHVFIRELELPFCLALEHLVVVGSFFLQVVDHMRAIKRACIIIYRGSGKRLCHQHSAISIPFGSEDPLGLRSTSLVAYLFYTGSVSDYGWLSDYSW